LHHAAFKRHFGAIAELLALGADAAVQNKCQLFELGPDDNGYRCAAPHS
jgi:hypothetical protein